MGCLRLGDVKGGSYKAQDVGRLGVGCVGSAGQWNSGELKAVLRFPE